MTPVPHLVLCLALSGAASVGASASGSPGVFPREEPFRVRPFLGEGWTGEAVAYGPYRDGQRPGGASPSRDELAEDLRILAGRWNLIRMYAAAGPAETVLAVIRDEALPIRVLLGVWIAPEERRDPDGEVIESLPEARAENRREIETAVRLRAEYPDLIAGLSAGNETQVYWSAHRSPPELLIATVRELRARTGAPVTTADDFNFWNKPEARAVADELDFIVMHAHPLWNGLQLEEAMAWTVETFDAIRAAHPHRQVVLGETGWATRRHSEGEQAKLIKGRTGEEEQQVFLEQVTRWSHAMRIPVFFFEAFDESWKGGDHPDEVEKHWGLYRADRTPKRAVAGRTEP